MFWKCFCPGLDLAQRGASWCPALSTNANWTLIYGCLGCGCTLVVCCMDCCHVDGLGYWLYFVPHQLCWRVKTLASFLNAVHVITENISFCLKGVPMSTVDLIFFQKGWGANRHWRLLFLFKGGSNEHWRLQFLFKEGWGCVVNQHWRLQFLFQGGSKERWRLQFLFKGGSNE